MRLRSAVVITTLVLASLSGCSLNHVSPWEKGDLANPVMQRSGNKHTEALKQHAYISKEGTQGGFTTGAGGCGCN